jgi:hypothetical protein
MVHRVASASSVFSVVSEPLRSILRVGRVPQPPSIVAGRSVSPRCCSSRVVSRTGSTHPAPVARIPAIECVPLQTGVPFETPVASSSGVFLGGHGFEVIRSNAVFDLAEVVKLEPCGYRSDQRFIGESVCQSIPVDVGAEREMEHPISSRSPSKPQPAARCFLHFGPEPDLGGDVASRHVTTLAGRCDTR